MPGGNGSRDDRAGFRRIGAKLNIASEGRQQFRSINNRGTIEWHRGLPALPPETLSLGSRSRARLPEIRYQQLARRSEEVRSPPACRSRRPVPPAIGNNRSSERRYVA